MAEAQEILHHFNSFEEFLAFEEHSEIRYEYYGGEIFAMTGASLVHNELVNNIEEVLREQFKPREYKVYTENVKLEAIRHFYYPYPDIMVTCDTSDKNEVYLIKNPVIIVEVLSKNTAEHDRGFKWQQYRKLPSLQHFVLVSQQETLVEVFSRKTNNEAWLHRSYSDTNDEIVFQNPDFILPLQRIYEGLILNNSNENLQNP